MAEALTQELLDTIKDLVFCLEELEQGSDGFSLRDYRTNVLANANKILEENEVN
tara:strand:+ start:361 stop:522 length:162 start_codon:yes stop_codon:yes gene_type:complete